MRGSDLSPVPGGGAYTVQFSGARSEGKYYLRVSAGGRGGAAAGLYQLDAGFRRQLVSAADYAAGTLTAAAPAQYQQLDIARSQLQNFVLSASSGAGGNEAVRMTIYDEAGLAVVSLFAASGDTVTTTAYLAPGLYTVAFFGGTPSGLALDALTYSLRGGVLSDPIGSGLVDSGGNSVPVLPPPPPPGPGQPPPDYTWQSPAPTTLVAQRLFAWVNPWAL